MLLVGSDFSFISKAVRPNQRDKNTFKVLDRVISILNEESLKMLGFRVKAKYATPSEYFRKISKIADLPTIYNPDISHYDEHFHILHPEFEGKDRIDYWTGYFSNRPALKSLIYRSFSYFHAAETFSSLTHLISTSKDLFTELQGNRTYLSDPTSDSLDSLTSLSQLVSLGLHHDTLPSTSRSSVHDSETDRLRSILETSRTLLTSSLLSALGAT